MGNKELVDRLVVLSMMLQEEYLKRPENFQKERELNAEWSEVKQEILFRMMGA